MASLQLQLQLQLLCPALILAPQGVVGPVTMMSATLAKKLTRQPHVGVQVTKTTTAKLSLSVLAAKQSLVPPRPSLTPQIAKGSATMVSAT